MAIGLRGLSAKGVLALAATALPTFVVAAILGASLVGTVTHAQKDFERSSAASQHLTDIRVLLEREHGFVARIPAELDLERVDRYAEEAVAAGRKLEAAVAALAQDERIVAAGIVSEIAATRMAMRESAGKVVEAAKSFAQSTALELVNGPFEEQSKLLVTFPDAITSNVQNLAEQARGRLGTSADSARRLTPLALIGALGMIGLGAWVMRRSC